MSNFHMARDRETEQIVGLKVLDKKKTDALEARFKGSTSRPKARSPFRSIIRGSSTPIPTASRPTTSSSW